MAVDDGTDFTWHYDDITDTSWVWGSPSGYPLPYPQKVYTFHPRGYSGADWSFGLGAGASDSRTLVLSAFVDEPVLKVLNDYTYRFLYSEPSGAALTSVEDVTDYALGAEKASILEKTGFFDSILGGDYLEGFNDDYRRLAAVSFQGYLINTWWCYNSLGERWFSVWEGNCQFHSTVDVEYNTAWFYQYFWPELLGTTLEEWTGFEKTNAQGIYLSHDIGRYAHVYAQTYPHDMPVEENTNWLLMAYSYWKQQGDAVRRLEDDTLLGVINIEDILWPHAVGWLSISIGDRANWGKGYGGEAMRLVLNYAFRELNLHRVQLTVFEYNVRAILLYEKLGFRREGVSREFMQRDGKRYDMYLYGLLSREWSEG